MLTGNLWPGHKTTNQIQEYYVKQSCICILLFLICRQIKARNQGHLGTKIKFVYCAKEAFIVYIPYFLKYKLLLSVCSKWNIMCVLHYDKTN